MVFAFIKQLFGRRSVRNRREQDTRSLLTYWEQRSMTYGARAVLNLGHKEEEIEAVTRYQLETIFPHVIQSLRGDERIVLDFGCGVGRFTPHLAKLVDGQAIGVDPIRTLIDLAPKGPNVEYRISDGHRIPVADASVDLLWVCLVLGGLADVQLAETALEFARVLRPGGLLFLVENTAEQENCDHWKFRSIAEYQKLFPFATLVHLHDYVDLAERISIMAGRKERSPSCPLPHHVEV